MCCLLVGGGWGPGVAAAWSEFGLAAEAPAESSGLEIQEPFFEFLIGMIEADSLGEWTGDELRSHAQTLQRESRFPLAELVSLSRVRPDSMRSARYPGLDVSAVWRLVLAADQDRAMPYSIMGYHPGSLRIARELVLSELAPGDLTLDLEDDNDPHRVVVTGVSVFALERGHVLLDADGWLDALLGSGLDDAWILGFVIGRQEGRLLGLGVSLGREGRHIYGEFDFGNDRVLAHGRPLASALSRLSRNWLNTADGNLPTPWLESVEKE